jgi:hypothetical protein
LRLSYSDERLGERPDNIIFDGTRVVIKQAQLRTWHQSIDLINNVVHTHQSTCEQTCVSPAPSWAWRRTRPPANAWRLLYR